MAKLTLMLDSRYSDKEGKYPVVIRVSHKQVVKNIQTGYKASLNEWNEEDLKLKKPFKNTVHANAIVDMKMAIARDIISRYYEKLKTLDVHYIVARIEEEINLKLSGDDPEPDKNKTSLFTYGKSVIVRLKKAKRDGNALAYESALSSFRNFVNDKDLFFSDITINFLNEYEAECRGKGLKVNSYGAYLRGIRALFNLAIKDKSTEVTKEMYPFGAGGYTIRVAKAKKRAISQKHIEVLRNLELKEGSEIWNHRNYWLFLFNMRGLNFIDFAFLTKSNISSERLKYIRKKTKVQFDLALTNEAKKILSYYINAERPGDLIFPIMENLIDEPDSYVIRNKYKHRLKIHNKYLKKLAEKIEEITQDDIKLTTYVARHSFATIGLRKGVDKSKIGDMLGHADYNVTEAYFADFEQDVLDQAAETILN